MMLCMRSAASELPCDACLAILVSKCNNGSRTPSLMESASSSEISSQGSCANRALQAAICPVSASCSVCADPCVQHVELAGTACCCCQALLCKLLAVWGSSDQPDQAGLSVFLSGRTCISEAYLTSDAQQGWQNAWQLADRDLQQCCCPAGLLAMLLQHSD